VYLTGPWPETITLNALSGDSTVIIIVNELGEQTTINADGTITTGTYSGNQNENQNQNGGDNSGGSGTDTGSGDNPGGGDTPSGNGDGGNEEGDQN